MDEIDLDVPETRQRMLEVQLERFLEREKRILKSGSAVGGSSSPNSTSAGADDEIEASRKNIRTLSE